MSESGALFSKKRGWFMGLPGSAMALLLSLPILMLIFGFISCLYILPACGVIKFFASRGWTVWGFCKKKLARYAGGYQCRPFVLNNVD